jgi:hypothetical protein
MLTRRNGESPPKGPAPASFAAKATDLQALRDAVVDAAGVGTGLWLSYLFALFYFAIAAGAVTHRDLLLENLVKLPFLNVELPLKAFFILGPLVFLIVHAYVLLHFVLLAGKIGAFHKQLEAKIGRDNVKTEVCRQLPSNIFVQSLAGPLDVRTGVVGFLLRLVIWISLIAGPIALLILFQLQFLPYHSEWITNWHRTALVLDLGLLWVLWPPIARGETKLLGLSDFGRSKIQAWACVSVLPVLLVVTIATFPGEWLEENLPSFRFVPTAWPKLPPDSAYADKTRSQNQSPKAALTGQPPETPVAGPTPFDTSNGIITTVLALMKLGSLDELLAASFPDYVPFKKAVTAAFASTEPRSLHELLVAGTINYVTDSPKSLWSNVLVLPDFKAGDRVKFDAEGKIAIGSDALSLRGRDLQRAALIRAHLDKADFTGARLQGSSFSGAELHEAKFECDRVGLEEACAQLSGASLQSAHLEGASFFGAQLQGASLVLARLQGASLYNADLRGALLDMAELEGADLSDAQVQGASLAGTKMQGAQLRSVYVWRTSIWNEIHDLQPNTKGALIVSPRPGPEYTGPYCSAKMDECPWSLGASAKLRTLIEVWAVNNFQRLHALKRIAILEKPPYVKDVESASEWDKLERISSHLAPDTLAKTLEMIGCTLDGNPYVIRGLLPQLGGGSISDNRFQGSPSQAAAVANLFLDKTHCAGAGGLSEADRAKLQEIANRGSPVPSPRSDSP